MTNQWQVSLALCWSHVRRRFYELAQSGPAPIASEALQRIAELYRIEAAIRGHDADARRIVRQEKSRPILEAMKPWLREKLSLISQKTKLAGATRYALSRWQGLSLFLDDGCVEIDSNTAERSIVSDVPAAPLRQGSERRCLKPLRASTHDDFRAYA